MLPDNQRTGVINDARVVNQRVGSFVWVPSLDWGHLNSQICWEILIVAGPIKKDHAARNSAVHLFVGAWNPGVI
jgi:hypothetical protein